MCTCIWIVVYIYKLYKNAIIFIYQIHSYDILYM